MSSLAKFVKKYEVLIGMGLLMGCVHYSWSIMQVQMETEELNKASPWIRVSWTQFRVTLHIIVIVITYEMKKLVKPSKGF